MSLNRSTQAIYRALGIEENKPLPASGVPQFFGYHRWWRVLPRHASFCRVQICCPKCGKWMSIGRYGQHNKLVHR